jgi:hypothetical protein
MSDDINAKFRDEFLDTCRKMFVDAGFQSPRKWTINLGITDDFLGWVGLNSGLYPDHVFLSPFIGIHVVPIQRLLDEDRGRKYRKGASATISMHMGELTPKEKVFYVTRENKDLEAARLVSLIGREAVPWMHMHATYEALLPHLDKKLSWLNGNPEKYAATLSALGRLEEMRQFINDIERDLSTDVSPFKIPDSFKQKLGYYEK